MEEAIMKAKVIGTLVLASAIAIIGVARGAEKKVTMNQLPAAVQQAIKDRLQGGTVRGLSMEENKGKKTYEAELTIGGRNTDLSLDEQGKVLEAELATTLEKIPAAARDAIQKTAGAGKITLVEEVTGGGKTLYEAEYTRGGKTSEVRVDADGHTVK
jgi:uncharacterized membrane protein YkoI